MAARAISKEELGAAVKEYAARHELTMSSNDKGFALMPGDIIIGLHNGGLSCADSDVLDSIREILLDMAENAPKGGNLAVRRGSGITSRSQAGSVPGSATNAAQAIQIMQAGKDLTYTVQKKQAPNATMALMAATDAKIDLVEINSILTDEMASSTIRATRKDRSVDATVSIRKADFINLLAWKEVQAQEAAKNYILDDSDPLNIALPNGFPRIRPDAMVAVRINDDLGSRVEKRRAMIHIYLTAMQQWIFQQRQCQTKAKRNATIQMLTSSGNPMEAMDEEELADEAMESQIVQEVKA